MIVRLLWLLMMSAVVLSFVCDTARAQQSAEEPRPKLEPKAAVGEKGHAPDEKAKGAGETDHAAGEKGHAAAGEHAAHDPYDLSHANATRNLTDPSALQADAAIATFVIFLLLLGILIKFAWGPISRGLEARERSIAERIEQARIAAEQAAEQLRAYEAKLAAAAAEAQAIVAKARQDADAAAQRMVAEASAAAQKERERALADIAAAKRLALREIAEKSVDTAIGLARNILRRELRPADHEQLIQDALKQFPHTASAN
jgi:F-type H+-transporting ATPase subunit b